MVAEFIKKEDKKHPLSDEEIKDKLVTEGVEIKRRTVQAYREKLKIPASNKRKK